MINLNGALIEAYQLNATENRAFKFGDSIFETIKYSDNKIHYLEDHYFRLMASMRMMRMEIPMKFTMEFMASQILSTIESTNISSKEIRIRFTVFRKDGGLYLPKTNDIDFIIEVSALQENKQKESYEIDLYKDFYVLGGLMSTIKTNNRMQNVVASIYANENGYDNCILLNERKHIAEAINGNIFIVKGSLIKTPAITEGCINGVIRKKVIEYLSNDKIYDIEESTINPFELMKADEVFITNAIIGIQSVTKYRKKHYTPKIANEVSKGLRNDLNLG